MFLDGTIFGFHNSFIIMYIFHSKDTYMHTLTCEIVELGFWFLLLMKMIWMIDGIFSQVINFLK